MEHIDETIITGESQNSRCKNRLKTKFLGMTKKKNIYNIYIYLSTIYLHNFTFLWFEFFEIVRDQSSLKARGM